MNRRRLLLLSGLALLLLCSCAAALLFFFSDGDVTPEAAERAVVTLGVDDANSEDDNLSSQTVEADASSAQMDATDDPTDTPTDEPLPTADPTPTDEPTATPVPPLGMSRSNPYPIDSLVKAPNWDIQILEVIKGDEAWAQIQAANQFNEPSPEGMEYLLVKIKATSTYSDAESHSIDGNDFAVTGDRFVYYQRASIVPPEPELSAELFPGGETEGWIPFTVGVGEGSLMVVVDELLNFDDDRFRFIALDEGASVVVDQGLFDIDPASAGLSRSSPASLGETVTTDDWEITVLDMIRGDEAWAAVQTANQFNEPPNEGMEYVAVKLAVRYIGTVDRAVNIDGSEFDLTGEHNILYNRPSIVDPTPALDVYLYPGGQYEGWNVMEAQQGEGHLMVRFEPLFEFTDNEARYLALVDQASVAVPAALSDIEPNGLGLERSNPAPLGETVITDNWELTITEVVRGIEALTLVQQANQFNDPPDPGMEYVAIKVRVRNISTDDKPEDISDSSFRLVDNSNIEFDLPSIVEPDPALDIRLYPDGEYEGWVVLQASDGGSDLIALVSPMSFETIYMALEP